MQSNHGMRREGPPEGGGSRDEDTGEIGDGFLVGGAGGEGGERGQGEGPAAEEGRRH